MAQYIAMTLKHADGSEVPVWQKIEVGQKQIVIAQIVTYVDANDQPVALPETYEMTVIDGEARDHI